MLLPLRINLQRIDGGVNLVSGGYGSVTIESADKVIKKAKSVRKKIENAVEAKEPLGDLIYEFSVIQRQIEEMSRANEYISRYIKKKKELEEIFLIAQII